MIEPRLFTAEQLEACVQPPPTRADMFVVLAYWALDRRWKLAPGGLDTDYATEEAARDAAANLSPGWTQVDIIRIPGGE